MKTRIGKQRKPSQPVNKALGLPSTYSTSLHIEGWIDKDHWTIKRLTSTTGGQVTVWATSQNWGDWKESNATWFTSLADLMVHGTPKPEIKTPPARPEISSQ